MKRIPPDVYDEFQLRDLVFFLALQVNFCFHLSSVSSKGVVDVLRLRQHFRCFAFLFDVKERKVQ